jgi:sorbitol-6-phosphate 2-dehydrogenase
MSTIDHAILAPLVRGLCLNSWGKSLVVISDPRNNPEIPGEALSVDLTSVLKADTLDEAGAAKLLSESCASWKFDHSPSGVEALTAKGKTLPLPSCVGITLNGQRALYWIGSRLEEARARAEKKDASPLMMKPSEPVSDVPSVAPRGADASGRSEVVRNRIALVTGGAQGFGEEIVRGLVQSGALVYIADVNLPGAEQLAATLNAAMGSTVAIPVGSNVADEGSVQAMFRFVAETTGGLDLCVSNAGVLKAASVLEQDLGAFKFVTDVNYVGFFLVAKYAGALFKRQNRTAPLWKTDLIQINSKSGLEGSNKNGAYAGSKFGGLGLVESFALELVEYGIKVNAICPGNFLDGPLWSDPDRGLFVQYLRTGKVPGAKTVADVRAFYESKVPMKRGCTGPDVMRALYYIVEQEYETGQAVPVTGGQVMLH